MLRRCLTRLRATAAGRALPLERCVSLHQLLGSAVLALAVLHTGAHVANFGKRGGCAAGEGLRLGLGLRLEMLASCAACYPPLAALPGGQRRSGACRPFPPPPCFPRTRSSGARGSCGPRVAFLHKDTFHFQYI